MATFPLISARQYESLKQSLYFFHVAELRELCTKLSIPNKGNKGLLINRILHYLGTGAIIIEPKIPKESCAQRGQVYPPHPNTKMIKDVYKNDLLARNFFKQLIGNHFHFTAFGIDWLTKRWIDGNPPTYQEFADMWTTEYEQRKNNPSAPKAEWAFITFTQKFIVAFPNATRNDITKAWETERIKQKEIVTNILSKIL